MASDLWSLAKKVVRNEPKSMQMLRRPSGAISSCRLSAAAERIAEVIRNAICAKMNPNSVAVYSVLMIKWHTSHCKLADAVKSVVYVRPREN